MGLGARDSLRVIGAQRPTRVSQQLFLLMDRLRNFPSPCPRVWLRALFRLGLSPERRAEAMASVGKPPEPPPIPRSLPTPGFHERLSPQLSGRGEALRGLPGLLGPLSGCGSGGGVGGGVRLRKFKSLRHQPTAG